jgi:hypothetical protein
MKTDDFEQRLQRVAPREIPPAWREEILTVARQAEVSHRPAPATCHSLLARFIQQLSTLTRPQRAAWGSLAAVWLVITGLNLTARDDSATAQTQNFTPPSPQAIAAWRQQRRELAGLTDPTPARPIMTAPKQSLPQPRSNRRDETSAV